MEKLANFIHGDWKQPLGGRYFPKIDPATGAVLCEVPDSDLMDLAQAVRSANNAWAQWQKSEIDQRVRLLLDIADKIESKIDAISNLQSLEEGMPIRYTKSVSLIQAVSYFRSAAHLLMNLRQEMVQGSSGLFFKSRTSCGVVAIIAPAFDSLSVISSRVAAALASGNVIILKASSQTPQTARIFTETLLEAGLQSGVFNLLQGRGEEIGRAIVSHPGLSTLSFSGASDTGKEILRESAEFLKKTQLSLGGKNPVLVFPDGNWESLVPSIVNTCFGFHGPTQLRGSRIFVQESIYETFLEIFKAQTQKMVIGNPLDEKTDLGPLMSDELKKRFAFAIDQGLGEKGKPLFGGKESVPGLTPDLKAGFFVQPTALFDLTNCSTLQQEEIIGPFVTIGSFKYQHEAVKHANTGPFGQAAYVYQLHGAKASRTAMKLEAGRIFVNSSGPLNDNRTVFSGLKSSGLGGEGLEAWMRFFAKESLIAQDINQT